MGIVVSHQPALAAPGLMSARTGQLEYRNQRRRELEALAMQQAEMAQRARMQRESIAAGFQRQNMAHMQNMQQNAWQQHWQQGRDERLHQNQVALNQQDFVQRQQMLAQGFQNNKQLREFDNQLRMNAGDHRAQQDQAIQAQHDFHQTRLKNLSPQAQALYREELNNFHSTKMEVPEQEHGQLQEQSDKILDSIYNNPANQADRSNDPGYITSNGFEDGIDLINGNSPGQKIAVFNGTIKNPEYNPQAPPDPINNPERIEVSIPDYEEQSKKRIFDANGNQIGHSQIKIDPLTGQAQVVKFSGEEDGYLTPTQKADIQKTRTSAINDWVNALNNYLGDSYGDQRDFLEREFERKFPKPDFSPEYYPTEESRGEYFARRAESEAAEEAALRPPAAPEQQAPQAQQQQAPQIQGVPENADDAAIQQAPFIEQGQEAEAVQQMGDGEMVRIQGPDGNNQIIMKVKQGGPKVPVPITTDDARREAGLEPIPEGGGFNVPVPEGWLDEFSRVREKSTRNSMSPQFYSQARAYIKTLTGENITEEQIKRMSNETFDRFLENLRAWQR